MKKNSVLRRVVCFAASAVLLAGLMTSGILSVSAAAKTYDVTAGSFYKVNASSLNVRSGPGLTYARRGSLANGSAVKVLEVSNDWARISGGWVSLQYLVPTTYVEAENTGFTGFVTASSLNVRQGPGANYAVSGQVMDGMKLYVEYTENGWGKIHSGWVNLDYVSRSSSPAPAPAPTPKPVPEQKPAPRPGYADITVNSLVQSTVNLNVRKGPGVGYPITGALMKGKTDTILETENGWGRTASGWIALNYVRLCDDGSHVSYRNQLVEVTAESLNVRTGPGFNYQPGGAMTKGFRTYVSEVEDGWGRTSSGWICLDYAKVIE